MRTSNLLDDEKVAVDPRLLVLLEPLEQPWWMNHSRNRILHVLQGGRNGDDLLNCASQTL
jgi:hypothetical protein